MSKSKGTRVYLDSVSTTDPNDPDAVPAFETSAGISSGTGRKRKPVLVNRMALENFNQQLDPAVVKRQAEAANVAALYSKRALRPDEIAAAQRRMFEIVVDSIDDAAEVMKGSKNWSPTQVRIFSIFADRVMPKIGTAKPAESQQKKLDELSLEELERIALGKRNHEAVDALVKQGGELEKQAEESEAKALKKMKALKDIVSLDEGKQAYVAKLEGTPKEIRPKKPGTLPRSS